jgi:quinol monooxygenase YgiN
MAGVVSIPWYATVFRGDKFELAIMEIAPVAARYGATDYRVYRQRDDPYRFLQLATFEDHADWDRYWHGEEFSLWRADYTSWYQVPVLYQWNDLIVQGALGPDVNGHVGGAPPGEPRGAMG